MRFSSCFLAAAGLALGASASGGPGSPVTIGYYPSWKKQYMSKIDFSLYSHINLAFAVPLQNGTLTFDGDWFLPQVVSEIHSKGTKAILSVGGWTGSNYLSNIVKNSTASNTLIQSMIGYIKNHQLDGIDIDWEYPGRIGNACNVVDPQNDTKNFLVFLQKLRQQLDAAFGAHQKIITLALRAEPFDGPNGPLSDVSAFAKYVSFGNLMLYDVNGGWGNDTGPNAPFNFEKGKGTQLSFVSAIESWIKAGWPAHQLVAGFAFYGRSAQALGDMTKDPKNQYQPQSHVLPLGDKEDASSYDACEKKTSNSGTWQWKHLRDQGVLSSPTAARAPWVMQWDAVSQTPWLFNPQNKTYISYDDPRSLQIKVDYAATRGLAGAMVWSMNMDSPNNELLAVLRDWTSCDEDGDA